MTALVPLPAPIKKSVTAFQITQFFSCIVHAVLTLLFDRTPLLYSGVQVVFHVRTQITPDLAPC